MAEWKFRDGGSPPAHWPRERKIEALLPLANLLERKWSPMLYGYGMTAEDIISAAMVGICQAVDRYRDDKGAALPRFANLCATREIMDEAERYNLSKAAARRDGKYVSWVSLDQPGPGGLDTLADMLDEMIDPGVDVETDALSGADFAAAWTDWRAHSQLTPMEKRIADEAVLGYNGGGLAERTGLSDKQVDNTCVRVRRKIRAALQRAGAEQGIDIATARSADLLKIRIGARKE